MIDEILRTAMRIYPRSQFRLRSQNGQDLAADVLSKLLLHVQRNDHLLGQEDQVWKVLVRFTRWAVTAETRRPVTAPIEKAHDMAAPEEAQVLERRLRENLLGRGFTTRDKRILILTSRGATRTEIAIRLFGENSARHRHTIRMAMLRIREKLAA